MKRIVACLGVVAFLASASVAGAAPVTFSKLTGVAGGTLAATGVWIADLSGVGVGSILSITIADNSGGLSGSPGQFSAFDLDAIKLSNAPACATAACASALVGLSAFDFSPAGTLFVPGSQRVPVDPKLYGTGPGGNTVDNAVATLGSFDGESSTVTPFGFVSMGDGGLLSFNLTGPVSTSGLYLYIGEVGDNGELAAGRITVSDTPVPPVPEPASMLLFGTGLAGLLARRRAKR